MATKKTATSSKKSTRKAPTTTKTTTTKVKTVSASASRSTTATWTDNLANILVAELVGTFVLTVVALAATQVLAPLYVGLTLAVLVFAIGAVSGSHVNPAVTFGLWAMRRVKGALVPFYWIAQLLGALGAVVVMNAISGQAFNLDFSHFSTFSWSIFSVELIGTAVFLFGLGAVLLRDEVNATGKALGIGLSLTIGLMVATSLLANVSANVDQSKIESKVNQTTGVAALNNVPHEMRVGGAALNPAVALAATEKTDAELQSGNASKDEKRYSRLGFEVILGTLIGAALGGNLYLLLANRLRK